MKNRIITKREGKKRITKNVINYISENKTLSLAEFKQNMEKQNVPICYVKS